jgi:hypothetical protein
MAEPPVQVRSAACAEGNITSGSAKAIGSSEKEKQLSPDERIVLVRNIRLYLSTALKSSLETLLAKAKVFYPISGGKSTLLLSEW